MRVLQVNKFLYRRGGAEAYMLDLSAMLADRGHDVEHFGMQHPSNLPMTYQDLFPSHVEFAPPPDAALQRVRQAGRMLWSKEAAAGMSEVVRRFQPDIVHLHNIYHQLSPSILAPLRRHGIPAVMTLHDYKLACPTYQLRDTNPANGGPKPCTACVTGGPMQALRRRCKDGSVGASGIAALEVSTHRRLGAYDPIDTFVCPSTFLARVMSRAGVYPDRLRVIDNFTDVDGVPARQGAGDGFVFAGRLSEEKGIDTLIDAMVLLAQRGQPDVRLQVAGEGPQEAALRRIAAEGEANVTFHGRLDKQAVADLMRSSRASVIPARWHENQPLSVLESLAAGVPVVATRMGGLPDVVTDQVNGLLVAADDPESLADALSLYSNDPERAAAHGAAAREAALRRFGADHHLDLVLSTYSDVLNARSDRELA